MAAANKVVLPIAAEVSWKRPPPQASIFFQLGNDSLWTWRSLSRHRRPRVRSTERFFSAVDAPKTDKDTQTPGNEVLCVFVLQIGERLKGIVVDELDGATGKKAWVRLGVTRRAKGGTQAYVDGMLRLNKEKGLKPKKVAIDRPVTVYVKEVSQEIDPKHSTIRNTPRLEEHSPCEGNYNRIPGRYSGVRRAVMKMYTHCGRIVWVSSQLGILLAEQAQLCLKNLGERAVEDM